MTTTLEPIQTAYKGYRFRSRLEARYAVLLDSVGVNWLYETEGYELSCGRYLPDFYIPSIDAFMEVKPSLNWTQQQVYLAGTCKTEWRSGLDLYGHLGVSPKKIYKHDDFGEVLYREAYTNLLECDLFFAWIDRTDCYGTLVEAGIAAGLHKRTVVCFPVGFRDSIPQSSVYFDYNQTAHDLWFVQECADSHGEFSDPQTAIDAMFHDGKLKKMPDELCKAKELAMASGKCVWVVCNPSLACISREEVVGVEAACVYPSGSVVWQPFFEMFSKWTKHTSAKQPWLENAFRAFRSARFEFGESGATY